MKDNNIFNLDIINEATMIEDSPSTKNETKLGSGKEFNSDSLLSSKNMLDLDTPVPESPTFEEMETRIEHGVKPLKEILEINNNDSNVFAIASPDLLKIKDDKKNLTVVETNDVNYIIKNKAQEFVDYIFSCSRNEIDLINESINRLGAKSIEEYTNSSNLLLKDPIKNTQPWLDKKSEQNISLQKIISIIEKLDPNYKISFVERFNVPKNYQKRYNKFFPQIKDINSLLNNYKISLMLDSQNLNVQQQRNFKCEKFIKNDLLLCKSIDEFFESSLNDKFVNNIISESDKIFYETNVLFNVKQRLQFLDTFYAVLEQSIMSLNILLKDNGSLQNTISSVLNVTLTGLSINVLTNNSIGLNNNVMNTENRVSGVLNSDLNNSYEDDLEVVKEKFSVINENLNNIGKMEGEITSVVSNLSNKMSERKN